MAHITVLGGGISGLSAAHYVRQLLPAGAISSVVLVEASNRLGGWLHSLHHPSGTIMELGPRTLRAGGDAGANTIALANQLGLEEFVKAVPYSHVTAQNRMIKVKGQLHTLPNSLESTFKTSPPFSKPLILAVLRDLSAPMVVSNDESVYSFVSRRFGNEVASFLIDPMARGIFAGNARDLSIKAFAKNLHDYEQQYGGVVKGFLKRITKEAFTRQKNNQKEEDDVLKDSLVQRSRIEKWSVWSLEDGIERLPMTLEASLGDQVEFRLNSRVDTLSRNDDGSINVQCGNDSFRTDRIISCLPANQLSGVISNLNADVAKLLHSIPYVTVGLVNLEYEGAALVTKPAFGYLVPSTEPGKVLGVIFDTCGFPQENRTVLTVMMGGYWFESLFGSNPSKESLLATAVEEVKSTLGIQCEPRNSHVSILRDCIPQYVVGHSEVVKNARRLIEQHELPIVLAGNSYDGAGVNDAILSTKNAVFDLDLN